jgi:hypothetical protein
VAKGFSQKYGVDFTEIFSPVMSATSFRILVAISVLLGLHMEQGDVETAFLNAELSETIYMEQPEGFVSKSNPRQVCKLNKSIYGLKQSPREWYSTISKFFIDELKLKRNRMDSCIFSRIFDDGSVLIVGIYVDDIIICASNQCHVQFVKGKLQERFRLSNIGNLKYCLGIQVQKDNKGGITLNQDSFISRTLKKFGMAECKGSKTPMMLNQSLSKEGEECEEEFAYREIIGSCMYAMIMTRPDIAFTLSQLSRFLDCYNRDHVVAAKRLLRYLKETVTTGIRYSRPETFSGTLKLSAYCDADWGGSIDDSRSTSGYVIFLNGCAIIWKSSKQSLVALSSAEAEYVALAHCVQESLWISQLIQDLGLRFDEKISIFEDNQACIKIAKNASSSTKTKHIRMRYHFVKELIEEKKIEIHWTDSESNIADVFTKSLGKLSLEALKQKLGLFVQTK